MRWRIAPAAVVAFVLAAGGSPAWAQRPPGDTLRSPPPAEHALVLSGGGARGIAHAGAIEALDLLGYDPPLVVGASMGALVGALYAAGYDAARIRRVITDENWLDRFAAEPLAVGVDRAPRRPLVGVGLGRNRLPGGIIPTIGVNQRLVELLFDAGARARNDFDALPRRYRAVATDLATGAQVVLAAGDLPRAARASMAVPGAFAPVSWGDLFLTDGGVSNNLPVSVARDVAQLPVLAIDVLRPTEEIVERHAVDIGIRGLRLLIENATPPGEPPEILVVPRIRPGFSEARFPADPNRLLDAGRSGVLEQVPPAAPAATSALRPAGAAPDRIDHVVVTGGDRAIRRLARRVMAPVAGSYDADDVVARTAGLYRTGLFEAVWPALRFEDEVTLIVDLTPINRTSLTASAHWDNDIGGGAWAALRHLLTLHTPVELHATLLVDDLDRQATVDASVFSAVLPGIAWNGGVHAGEARLRLFDGDSVTGLPAVRRVGAWVGAERRGLWFVSLLARADRLHFGDGARAAFDRDDNSVSGWSFGPFLRIARAPRPDATMGVEPLLEAETRTGDVAWARLHARHGIEAASGQLRVALFADVAAASADAPPDLRPAATTELAPWLPTGALRARTRTTAGVDATWPLVLDGYLRLRLRGFAAANTHDGLRSGDAWLLGSELGVVWPTVIGQLRAGVAAGGQGRGARLNLGLGSGF